MHEITPLELSILAGELGRYEGFRVEKFYETGPGRFRIKLKGEGRDVNLECRLCREIAASQYIEKAGQPTSFAMAVRRRIEGLAISGVRQLGKDRILVFSFGKGEKGAYAIFEMFGRGNLIITDSAMRITLAYVQHEFKDRSIKVGAAYTPPRPAERRGAGSLISVISAETDAGPLYIEDALLREGIEPSMKAEGAHGAAVERAVRAISAIKGGCAIVYLKDGEAVEYSLTELKRYEGFERRDFGTLEEALSFAYEMVNERQGESPEARRIEASIEKQKALSALAVKEAGESREIAKLLFERMGEINRLVETARAGRRITLVELRSRFPDIKISDISLKDKTVTIEE